MKNFRRITLGLSLAAALLAAATATYAGSTSPGVWENDKFTKFRQADGNPAVCNLEARMLEIDREGINDVNGATEITLADESLNFTVVQGTWSLDGSSLRLSAPGFSINGQWGGNRLTAEIVHTLGSASKTFSCTYRVSGTSG